MRDCLERAPSVHDVWRPFFKRAGRIIDGPWMIAAGSDFAFEGVTGSDAQPARAWSTGTSTASTRPRRPIGMSAARSSRRRTCWRPRLPCSGRPSWCACGGSAWRFEGRWRSSRTGRSRPAASECSKRTDPQLTRVDKLSGWRTAGSPRPPRTFTRWVRLASRGSQSAAQPWIWRPKSPDWSREQRVESRKPGRPPGIRPHPDKRPRATELARRPESPTRAVAREIVFLHSASRVWLLL